MTDLGRDLLVQAVVADVVCLGLSCLFIVIIIVVSMSEQAIGQDFLPVFDLG